MSYSFEYLFQYGEKFGNFGVFKYYVERSNNPDWVYIWNLIQESGNDDLIKWAVCKVYNDTTLKDTIRMVKEDRFGCGSGI